jgi:glycosyltransferase involved in cell wall biosynthesis
VRLAVLTPYLPHPLDAGGKIRSFHLLRGLARAHEVDLYTLHHGEAPDVAPVFRENCRSVFSASLTDGNGRRGFSALDALRPFTQTIEHFRSPRSLSEIRGRLAAGGYDLLVADELCMTPYSAGLPGRKLGARQKIEHLHHRALAALRPPGARRWIEALDLARLRRFERRAMAAMDAAVCCSEEDARLLRTLNPSAAVAVVPNGVDPEHFRPAAERPGPPPTVVFVGTLDYPPNVDAVEHFFNAIHPRLLALEPELRVRLVGRSPAPEVRRLESRPGVTVAADVPDVRPHLADAAVVVVPLRVGGGTRIKILEALSAARPVVSTTVGAEGLGLRDGEHLLIADQPEAFARAVARLLGDASLRRALAEAGRRVVVERFAWSSLGRRFADVCARVAETGKP